MFEPIKSMEIAFSLKGKTALITGGSTGLGFGIATAMAQQGADIAIVCRNLERGQKAMEQLKPYGGRYEAFRGDTSDLHSIRAAVAEVYDAFGQVDILVNNAGVACEIGLLDMDEELSDWYRVINTDLNGVIHTTYEVGKRMRAAGKGGCIINITSNAGLMVNKNMKKVPYDAAKAACNHITHSLAVEFAPYGIRVNAIAPGFTRSGFDADFPPERRQELCDAAVTGRFGEPIEIGALAVYLASDAASQMTGNISVLDGGYMLRC